MKEKWNWIGYGTWTEESAWRNKNNRLDFRRVSTKQRQKEQGGVTKLPAEQEANVINWHNAPVLVAVHVFNSTHYQSF